MSEQEDFFLKKIWEGPSNLLDDIWISEQTVSWTNFVLKFQDTVCIFKGKSIEEKHNFL